MHNGGFENPLEWLAQQVRICAYHCEYQRDGRLIASVTLNGEAALVRQLLDRLAELSESGRPAPQTADVLAHIHGIPAR